MRHKNLCVTRHFAWVEVRTAWRCVTERGARTELRLAMLITSRGPKQFLVQVWTLLVNIRIQDYRELS